MPGRSWSPRLWGAAISVLAVSVVFVWGEAGTAVALAAADSAHSKRVQCADGRAPREDRDPESQEFRRTMHEEAAAARRWIMRRLGKFQHPVCVALLRVNLGHAGAVTGGYSLRRDWWEMRKSGGFQVCLIRISARERSADRQQLRGLLAHELAHCRQAEVMGLARLRSSENRWLTDGSADYISVRRAGVWQPGIVDNWQRYATEPERSLFDRSYDAAGFFEHVARRVDRPYRVIREMWKQWRGRSVGARNRAAFAVAGRAGGGADFVRSWATSFMRRPDWGPDWEMKGTGLPGRAQASATPTLWPLWSGQPGQAALPAEAAVGLYQILAPAGSVVRIRGVGAGRLRGFDPRSPDRSVAGAFEVTYCVQACTCPDGTDLTRSMPTTPSLLTSAALSNAPHEGWFEAFLIDPPCPRPSDPTCPTAPEHQTTSTGDVATQAREQQWCLPHPCEWGFGVPEATQWIREGVDDRELPVEKVFGGPFTGGLVGVVARGCLWTDSVGDLVHIAEVADTAELRAKLAGLERVPVADEGWVEAMTDGELPNEDVYFRVGNTFAMAALWTYGDTDRNEAIAFANAVAAHVPRG
jgi:hypothetical protein